jgi:hypothetical protein
VNLGKLSKEFHCMLTKSFEAKILVYELCASLSCFSRKFLLEIQSHCDSFLSS